MCMDFRAYKLSYLRSPLFFLKGSVFLHNVITLICIKFGVLI